MAYRKYRAFIGSLGVVALMLAADVTFAASGAAHRGGFASTHSISRRSVVRSFRHHGRNYVGTFWPGLGDDFYGPPNGGPLLDGTQPISGDSTYTYGIPWDWAHRYPPLVTPSDRPYVSTCPAETVTVLGRDGEEQTVNIMRCY
jgi:hypothetical protein